MRISWGYSWVFQNRHAIGCGRNTPSCPLSPLCGCLQSSGSVTRSLCLGLRLPKTMCPSPSLAEQLFSAGHLLLICWPFVWTETLLCTREWEASQACLCALGHGPWPCSDNAPDGVSCHWSIAVLTPTLYYFWPLVFIAKYLLFVFVIWKWVCFCILPWHCVLTVLFSSVHSRQFIPVSFYVTSSILILMLVCVLCHFRPLNSPKPPRIHPKTKN